MGRSMARWKVAPNYQALINGQGISVERNPIDYLISHGYIAVYHEAFEEQGVKRWVFYRVWDGAEVAVEKRWGTMEVEVKDAQSA